jgi:DNA topoisomerase-2
MDEIRVDVDVDSGTISVYNNGKGIPVKVTYSQVFVYNSKLIPQIHKKEGIYVPELVFGHLFTGSNFDDSIVKVTGGTSYITCTFDIQMHLQEEMAMEQS